MAGMRLLGAIFKKAGTNCSPLLMLMGLMLYSRPDSSKNIVTLWPLGVVQ
jgi:hypothetical protein